MKIFVVDLESVPTRYTCQWKGHIPALLKAACAVRERAYVEIVNISGGDAELKATPGAFLNFAQTNVYKNNQLNYVAELFSNGEVSPGDQFIFTDAWHSGIIQLKYMSELLDVPVVIHALWHAGSYDPQDFLGRLIKDKRWANNFEKAVWHAVDYNWFATDFHIQMFKQNVFLHNGEFDQTYHDFESKSLRTGWPMEYMEETLKPYMNLPKRDLILFPHRVAPEKQVEIFRDLAKQLPRYEWVVCQDEELTKHEFHTLLGEAKMIFSANLQETLGISTCIEGPLSGALPLAPNRLSYSEIFEGYSDFLYPSYWTESYESFKETKEMMCFQINYMMDNYDDILVKLDLYNERQMPKFFGFDNAIGVLFND
jgi:glycosyltransferase involved in cell wall biosynthesis